MAYLFSCWLASTQHAQSAITPLMKPDPWSQNIITQKVQIILQIKMKSVFKDRICGLITEDFTYDYEINSEGTFQYAPDFSLFSLYGYNEALAPKQIRIRDASGYWIRFESGCQGGTRHNYSTHQVQYNDWAYYDLRIEHPPRSEHCNVYFDNHVYLRFPGYSGNVLTSPEPGFYYDTENIDYMVTPAIMQQAVREGSYHKTLQVRRGDGSEYRDLTLDITVLFEPKEEGVLKVTPPDGLDESCPSSNCDFKSLAKSYTLTNAGSSPINYTVSKTASWLELTPTGGVLQPGASTTVTASISVEAQKELKEGVHKDTLSFTNTTNGKGNTSRAVKLEKSERQCWRVTLTGQETDDMGGSLMTIKMEDVWKQVTVDYGVRFDYQLVAEFNIRACSKVT